MVLRAGQWFPFKHRLSNQSKPALPKSAPPPTTVLLALKTWAWQGNPPSVFNSSGTGATITIFQVGTTVSGSLLPFTLGLPQFPQGKTLGPLTLSIPNGQVIVMATWPDGTVKHAIASGHVNLTAGTPTTINVINSSNSGTNLTSANIATALNNPGQNVVNLGVNGSVDLVTLLGSPILTFVSGPQMVYCIYATTLSNNLYVQFHVQYYLFGNAYIRATVDNGYVDLVTSPQTYTVTIKIGGVNQSIGSLATPTTLTHNRSTSYFAKGWTSGNPNITPIHNTADIIASKLVPNYFGDAPPVSPGPQTAEGLTLSTMTQTYTFGGTGDWTVMMGDIAFHNQIGLLPGWDAMFITSKADPRAYRSVIANAEILVGTYGIVWRGKSDSNLPCRPSIYPTYTFEGPGGGGLGTPGYSVDGVHFWEEAHHGSAGYLAYLITGEYYFLQIMQHQSSLCYLAQQSAHGNGTSRALLSQTRGDAWILRTWSQLAAVCPPGDTVTADYAALCTTTVSTFLSTALLAGQNQLGIVYDQEVRANDYSSTTATGAPWQHDYLSQTFGMGTDIIPLSSMTNWVLIDSLLANYAILRMSDGSSGGFHFSYAGEYNLIEGPTPSVTDYRQLYQTWAQVFTANIAVSPLNFNYVGNTNTLQGSGAATPADSCKGYWGYLLPSIAYAVDHNYGGALAAWNRMVGATNWLTLRQCTGNSDTFSSVPIFGIGPRDALQTQLALMAPGTWKDLGTSTKMRPFGYAEATTQPDYNSGISNANLGSNGTNAVMEAWGGGCVDLFNNGFIVWGGGHGNYFGNEVYRLSFTTLGWARVTTPDDSRTLPSPSSDANYPNGNPVSTHAYCGMVYNPTKNYFLCRAGTSQAGFEGPNLAIFDVTKAGRNNPAGTWVNKGALPGTGGAGGSQTWGWLDKNGLHWIYTRPGQRFLNTFNATTNAQAAISINGISTVFDHSNVAYDPVSNIAILAGGGGYDIVSGLGGTPDINPGSPTGAQASNITNALSPGIAYHPPTGKWVGYVGGQTLAIGTPSTHSWVSHTAGGDVPPAIANAGMFGRFAYLSNYNCFMMINDVDQNIFIYKPDF